MVQGGEIGSVVVGGGGGPLSTDGKVKRELVGGEQVSELMMLRYGLLKCRRVGEVSK